MKNMVAVHNEDEWLALECPGAHLEQTLIKKYLAGKGYSLADLRDLPPQQARDLITEACQYASLRLTEIESAAHLWSDVEGSEQSQFSSSSG